MTRKIALVDRGRGLQLTTSRVTVQDLVPYFQQVRSYEYIIHWIPTLTHDEIAVVERYYLEHKAELDEEDRRIREQTAQRKNPDWINEIFERGKLRMETLKEQLQSKANGEAM